ncbi:major capsid protein [Paenibacillus elgii]
MPVALSFPTTQEVNHIVRKTIVDTSEFRGQDFCPMAEAFAAEIKVDVIDATSGITPPHALNADPKVATLSGQSVRKYATGYWRETHRINEDELLTARQEGTFNERAGRLRVIHRSNEMNVRLETRIEQLRWAAVTKGKIDVDENGVKYTVDMKIKNKKSYPILSDPSLSIPNILDELTTAYHGTGAKLAKIYFNHDIAKALAANSVIRDLLKQSVYATNLTSMNITNALKMLFPKIDFEVYTEGYSDGKNFVYFLPEAAFVCIGKGREKLMDFCSTIALQNGGLDNPRPGKYASIEDKSSSSKNPYVDVTVGINGLPRVHHPEWIISGTAN